MMVFSDPVFPLLVQPSVASGAIEKLNSFLSMRDGWYFGMGSAPSRNDVHRGILVAHLLEWRGFDVEAFPGEAGEILISGRHGNSLLEVTIEGESAFTIEKRRRGEESEPEAILSFHELVQRIWSTAPACNIYDSLIQGGGANETAASATWLSSRQLLHAAEAFLLSKRTAHAERAQQNALTWQSVTGQNFLHPSSLGSSTATYFLATR